MTIREFAPAKINLALHVTGRMPGGYHSLDSLVCFADIGDWLTVFPSDDLTLSISGAQGAVLPMAGDNLVLRAAKLMSGGRGAAIELEKQLPVAAGMGGGSADAAACLRALVRQWQLALPDAKDILSLGADVPVCLLGQGARMRGIGAALTLVPHMPGFDAVLVNPGVAVATADVFSRLVQKDNSAMPALPKTSSASDWIAFLRVQRNDLQDAAAQAAPIIRDVLRQLQFNQNCQLARMSGSGATCFAIYADATTAQQAANFLATANPRWWVRATRLGAVA